MFCENDSFEVTIHPRRGPIIAKYVLIKNGAFQNICDLSIGNKLDR